MELIREDVKLFIAEIVVGWPLTAQLVILSLSEVFHSLVVLASIPNIKWLGISLARFI